MTSVQTATDYTVQHIDQMEKAFGGMFVRARASLGVSSFGLQVLELPPDSGDAYPEHDHLHDGQEEVYLLLSGEAEMALPDSVVELTEGTFVRVGVGTRRRIRTGPSGARVLAIGGMPDRAFAVQPNSDLGGPETFDSPTASTVLAPDGPPAQLTTRGRF